METLVHYKDLFLERDVKISLPRSIFRVEESSFSNNNRLKKVSLSDNLRHIGERAFEGCKKLEVVKFRGTPKITYLPERCFAGCSSLREIYLPISLSVIKKFAFKDCVSLKKLVIPDTVTFIEQGAFDGWKEDQVIVLEGDYKFGIACKATIVNLKDDNYDEDDLVYITSEGKKMYAVDTKCGHVGNHRYMPITFAIKADNGKEAAKIARNKPRVKHDHKDAILDVRQISKKEFMEISERNYNDPYLGIKSKYQQKEIENLINERALPEKQRSS